MKQSDWRASPNTLLVLRASPTRLRWLIESDGGSIAGFTSSGHVSRHNQPGEFPGKIFLRCTLHNKDICIKIRGASKSLVRLTIGRTYMTKVGGSVLEDYLIRLERNLEAIPRAERQDILREISSHLADGLATGQSAEELVARLGAPEAIAEGLIRGRMVADGRQRTPWELVVITGRAAALPCLFTLLIVLSLTTIATLVHLDFQQWTFLPAVELTVMAMPAALLATIPSLMLLVGWFGLPALASEASQPQFLRIRHLVAWSLLGVGVAAAIGTFVIYERVVVPANSSFFKQMKGFRPGLGLSTSTSSTDGNYGLERRSRSQLAADIADLHAARKRLAEKISHLGTIQTFWIRRVELGRFNEDIARLETAYQLRFSIPALSFATTALGLVVGIFFALRNHRSGTRMGVVVTVLIVLLLDLTFRLVAAIPAAIGGAVAPVVFAWLPVAATLFLALVLQLVGSDTPGGVGTDA